MYTYNGSMPCYYYTNYCKKGKRPLPSFSSMTSPLLFTDIHKAWDLDDSDTLPYPTTASQPAIDSSPLKKKWATGQGIRTQLKLTRCEKKKKKRKKKKPPIRFPLVLTMARAGALKRDSRCINIPVSTIQEQNRQDVRILDFVFRITFFIIYLFFFFEAQQIPLSNGDSTLGLAWEEAPSHES